MSLSHALLIQNVQISHTSEKINCKIIPYYLSILTKRKVYSGKSWSLHQNSQNQHHISIDGMVLLCQNMYFSVTQLYMYTLYGTFPPHPIQHEMLSFTYPSVCPLL